MPSDVFSHTFCAKSMFPENAMQTMARAGNPIWNTATVGSVLIAVEDIPWKSK